jgi:soluble lytic murein transglycosylase
MSPLPILFSLVLATSPDLVSERDLTPLLQGRPAEAGRLLTEGKGAEAVAALGSAGRPEARWLRALAEESTGACPEALRSLDGLAARLPDLSGRIHAARGRCLAALGRHAEAATAFAAVPATSVASGDATVRRARSLAAAGRTDEALAALGPLLEQPPPADPARPDPAAAALALAGELRARATPSDAAGARAALLRCWAVHPISPQAPGCLASLRGLPGEAGAAPDVENAVRRAEGLVERSRSADAIALLEPLARGGPAPTGDQPLACRIHAALGRALKRDRQSGRAIDVLRPVAERCAEPEIRRRALYVLATAVQAQGSRDEAIALYRRFAREQPSSSLADDALVAAAELLVRAERGAEARQALLEVVRTHPDGDQFDEARFRLAWLARRDGDAARAMAALLAIEEERREVDPYEHARAAYWRAVLLQAQGPAGRAAAESIWRGLTTAAPADFYALLARARLAGRVGIELPAPLPAAPEAPWPLDPGPLRDDPHYRAGLLLLRLGLPRAADEELLAVDRSRLVSGRGEPSPPVVLLAALLAQAGDHREAHQLLRVEARAALRRPPEGKGRAVWALAYPPAYSRYVTQYAATSEVPPTLLQALMREESALDPEAVSPAGAIGLTQLMLPTAQQVARRLKLPKPDRDALTDPETSIRIGAAYLGQLLRRYGGGPAQALAAYNAGEGAVGRWRAGGRDGDLDEWVEEIPFDETRGYVKRVLRSDASYRLLSGRDGLAAAPADGARGSVVDAVRVGGAAVGLGRLP